jgi:hypothetical protein
MLDRSRSRIEVTTMETNVRVEFWRLTAEEFGLPLTGDQERELDELLDDDLVVLDRWFPHLADVERNEVLWALGEYVRARGAVPEAGTDRYAARPVG